MNWHKVLQEIYSILESNGHDSIAKQIRQKQREGATGGEILDIVLTELLHLKKDRVDVYLRIKTQVDSMIEYAKSIGYL